MSEPKNPNSELGRALGRLGAGKKKNYSEEERQKRRERLALARERRHLKKPPTPGEKP